MATTAPPTIPPRPVRAQAAAAQGASHLPSIPPRPFQKRLERPVSPSNYPHSPLNEPPFGSTLARPTTRDSSNVPERPPSVTLPSIGQEGNEYADIEYGHTVALPAYSTTQSRSIGGDLPLHAPRPSLPQASAKAQVAAVTKTDSTQAAAHGIGKPGTPGVDESHDTPPTPLRAKSSFSRPASQASGHASGSRRASWVWGEEQGPAEIGIRVPINPLLGDVQAPSPAPFGDRPSSMSTNGEFNAKRRHGRTKSGREVFLPPGSYGLHGHGVEPHGKFEKEWYAKHPEQALQDEEHGHYASTGSGRGEFALSSEDLNHIVRSTASRGLGIGTSGNVPAYPDEQIGYLASDQYTSRSQLTGPNYLTKMHSNISQPSVESPLHKTSFPADDTGHEESKWATDSVPGKSDNVIDSEQEEDVIHVDHPARQYNKVAGGEETTPETEDLRPHITHATEEGGLVDEHGYSVPILASDELAKEDGAEEMQPAVPPVLRGSAFDLEYHGSGEATPNSRPTSRPVSIHSAHGIITSLSRFQSRHDDYREDVHTPLEDVDEYEPLFSDEESKKKAIPTAERFKPRPDTLKHRFPSQDIWEDTPSSLMHVATVSAPDLPSQVKKETGPHSTFESPEAEAAREGEVTEKEQNKFIPYVEGLAKSRFAQHLRNDMPARPGMAPRFPSQDIWEETPESQYLVTTVSQPEDKVQSPTETAPKPAIPPRPNQSRLGEGASSAQVAPSVPARPQKYSIPPVDAKLTDPQTFAKGSSPTEIRRVPSIPDRPKPQVPARPAKKTSLEGLTKTTSATSAGSAGSIGSVETEKGVPVGSPPLAKVKPQVPERPQPGSKIANLKGNFMNDLNQKLGLGPPKEKEPEPEMKREVKPLEDARKGRARGPQRRAPAKSPAGAGESAAHSAAAKSVRFSVMDPVTIWHIDHSDGALRVPGYKMMEKGVMQEESGAQEVPNATSEAVEAAAPAEPVMMPDARTAQIEHSTPGTAAMAPTIDSSAKDGLPAAHSTSDEQPPPLAPAGRATNTSGEPTDPTLSSSVTTAPPPHRSLLSHLKEDDSLIRTSLSQQTTASSAVSGHSLNRVRAAEEKGPSLSQTSTAESTASGVTLEKVETVDPNDVEGVGKVEEEKLGAGPGGLGEEGAGVEVHATAEQ